MNRERIEEELTFNIDHGSFGECELADIVTFAEHIAKLAVEEAVLKGNLIEKPKYNDVAYMYLECKKERDALQIENDVIKSRLRQLEFGINY